MVIKLVQQSVFEFPHIRAGFRVAQGLLPYIQSNEINGVSLCLDSKEKASRVFAAYAPFGPLDEGLMEQCSEILRESGIEGAKLNVMTKKGVSAAEMYWSKSGELHHAEFDGLRFFLDKSIQVRARLGKLKRIRAVSSHEVLAMKACNPFLNEDAIPAICHFLTLKERPMLAEAVFGVLKHPGCVIIPSGVPGVVDASVTLSNEPFQP